MEGILTIKWGDKIIEKKKKCSFEIEGNILRVAYDGRRLEAKIEDVSYVGIFRKYTEIHARDRQTGWDIIVRVKGWRFGPAKVIQLENKIRSLEQNIQSIQGEVEKIGSIEQNISSIQNEIEDLKSTIRQLQQQITQVPEPGGPVIPREDLEALRQLVEQIRNDLNRSIDNLKNEFEQHKRNTEDLLNTIGESIGVLFRIIQIMYLLPRVPKNERENIIRRLYDALLTVLHEADPVAALVNIKNNINELLEHIRGLMSPQTVIDEFMECAELWVERVS